MNAVCTHTYVVPAYGHSPYLAACLESLAAQRHSSKILIATSTPHPESRAIAAHFGADYFEHGPNQGMSHDWNQGVAAAGSPWVTLAHQDDVYLPEYGTAVHAAIRKHPGASLIFTDYAELLSDRVRRHTTLLNIKQALLQMAFLGRSSIADRFSKLNCLRFGSPIPCPSVCFRQEPDLKFSDQFKVNMDWQAWVDRAKRPGSFVWIRQELMHHRLHESSETTAGIQQGYRSQEDLTLLRQLWPGPIANLIAKPFKLAYANNYNE